MSHFQNRVLTFEQGCEYLGYTKGYVHQLIFKEAIPFSKPNKKAIFFDRVLLEEWMLSNPRFPEKQDATNGKMADVAEGGLSNG